MGLFVNVDEGKATRVHNVFVCGDAARAAGNVTMAVADGAMGQVDWVVLDATARARCSAGQLC